LVCQERSEKYGKLEKEASPVIMSKFSTCPISILGMVANALAMVNKQINFTEFSMKHLAKTFYFVLYFLF